MSVDSDKFVWFLTMKQWGRDLDMQLTDLRFGQDSPVHIAILRLRGTPYSM